MAANLQNLFPSGWLKSLNTNMGLLNGFAGSGEGLGSLRVARYVFDWDDPDNAVPPVAISVIGAHAVGEQIPANSIVTGGFVEVITPITGVGASVALSVQGANDIVAAAAISGAPWSTVGRKAIVPKVNTPESTAVKLTTAKALTVTVSGAALTAGRLNVYLYYLEGELPT